jgi:hypothetical protein
MQKILVYRCCSVYQISVFLTKTIVHVSFQGFTAGFRMVGQLFTSGGRRGLTGFLNTYYKVDCSSTRTSYLQRS